MLIRYFTQTGLIWTDQSTNKTYIDKQQIPDPLMGLTGMTTWDLGLKDTGMSKGLGLYGAPLGMGLMSLSLWSLWCPEYTCKCSRYIWESTPVRVGESVSVAHSRFFSGRCWPLKEQEQLSPKQHKTHCLMVSTGRIRLQSAAQVYF